MKNYKKNDAEEILICEIKAFVFVCWSRGWGNGEREWVGRWCCHYTPNFEEDVGAY